MAALQRRCVLICSGDDSPSMRRSGPCAPSPLFLCNTNECFYLNVLVSFSEPSLYICSPRRLICPDSSAWSPHFERNLLTLPPPSPTTHTYTHTPTHPGPPAFLRSDEEEDSMTCSVIFFSMTETLAANMVFFFPPFLFFRCVICPLHPPQRSDHRVGHLTPPPASTVITFGFHRTLMAIFKTHCDVIKKNLLKAKPHQKHRIIILYSELRRDDSDSPTPPRNDCMLYRA